MINIFFFKNQELILSQDVHISNTLYNSIIIW